jgi:ABC-type thiamine transport system ATPase subunit
MTHALYLVKSTVSDPLSVWWIQGDKGVLEVICFAVGEHEHGSELLKPQRERGILRRREKAERDSSAVLEPEVAILDEIDSGLDVDALRDVAAAVNGLRSSENALLLITHYKRLLEYIMPDVVHVMSDGQIIKSGGMEIVDQLELGGYASVA